MATRNLLRRLSHISQRIHVRGAVPLSRPLSSITVFSQKEFQLTRKPQSYSQLRTLCSKAGEGMVINIQDEKDFEDRVMNSDVPVVLDFHASWCGPCKLLGPRLESLIGSRKGKVILAKIDVDDHAEISQKYMIRSVPTVVGIRNAQTIDQFIGLVDDDVIETFLDKLIG